MEDGRGRRASTERRKSTLTATTSNVRGRPF
jgi:hypothetical protein